MSQYTSRINVRVSSPSIWNRFLDTDDAEFDLAELAGTECTSFVIDGEQSCFNESELNGIVKALAETLGTEGIIIADTTNINVDPYNYCVYYFGESVKVACFEYDDMHWDTGIGGVAGLINCCKFSLTDKEKDQLFRCGIASYANGSEVAFEECSKSIEIEDRILIRNTGYGNRAEHIETINVLDEVGLSCAKAAADNSQLVEVFCKGKSIGYLPSDSGDELYPLLVAKRLDYEARIIKVVPLSKRNKHAKSPIVKIHIEAAKSYKPVDKNNFFGNDAVQVEVGGDASNYARSLARSISELPDGIEFAGKVFVHTSCHQEKKIDALVVSHGGEVKSSTVMKTNYLIIGNDIEYETTKITRARELIEQGKKIAALTESEFWSFVSENSGEPKKEEEQAVDMSVWEKYLSDETTVVSTSSSSGDNIQSVRAKIQPQSSIESKSFGDETGEWQLYLAGMMGRIDEVNIDGHASQLMTSSTKERNVNQAQKDSAEEQRRIEVQKALDEKKRLEDEQKRLENKHLLAEQKKKEEEEVRMLAEQKKVEEEHQRVEQEKKCLEEEQRHIEEQKRLFEEQRLHEGQTREDEARKAEQEGMAEEKRERRREESRILSEQKKAQMAVKVPEKHNDPHTSVIIPDGTTSIGYGAFKDNKSLESITIPNSVKSIDYFAFSGCTSLTSVTISNGVTSIGYGAFSGCSSLESITIPNSVTSIGDFAFGGCTLLASITIPDSVWFIGSRAFKNCSLLTCVTLSDSVTSMGIGAFENCGSLVDIVYYGTKKQWNRIKCGFDWKHGEEWYNIVLDSSSKDEREKKRVEEEKRRKEEQKRRKEEQKRLAEEQRKEHIYKTAMEKYESDDIAVLKAALSNLQSISDWKELDENISAFKDKIDNLIKEKRLREEQHQRELEQKRLEEQKNREEMQRKWEEEERRYEEARKAEEQKRIEAENQRKNSIYLAALTKCNANDIAILTQAIASLESISDWKDSKEQIKRCRDKMNALIAAEELKQQEKLKAMRRDNKLCQHCGGNLKGLFKKVCTQCGKPKDY